MVDPTTTYARAPSNKTSVHSPPQAPPRSTHVSRWDAQARDPVQETKNVARHRIVEVKRPETGTDLAYVRADLIGVTPSRAPTENDSGWKFS